MKLDYFMKRIVNNIQIFLKIRNMIYKINNPTALCKRIELRARNNVAYRNKIVSAVIIVKNA